MRFPSTCPSDQPGDWARGRHEREAVPRAGTPFLAGGGGD